MIKTLWLSCLLAIAPLTFAEEYLSQQDFLAQTFDTRIPEVSMVWLKAEQKAVAQDIFGHPYRGLRIRYWLDETRSAWILEEIGKEKPIRFGVVVAGGKIERLAVLAFNESRGWEIRHDFFTEQFSGLALTAEHKLSDHVDGITGATLSVRASTAVARWALYLDQLVRTAADGQ
ncbi:FMN-binding protein [Thalassolituus marinus]|uniref:FMN-binding protein n=1 Tax=Thalassolituus marinus TaxID=671053 RepID=A0ABS7ZLS2_9GAMM|nr:FMN-binding protein [Thalassolituus marinus]MCA6062666.1 FMN-binding protein [Thalassolituus marinus]